MTWELLSTCGVREPAENKDMEMGADVESADYLYVHKCYTLHVHKCYTQVL